MAALKQEVGRIIPTVARLSIANRRIDHGGGIGFRAPSYERRVVVILEMLDRLGSNEFAALLAPTMARLAEEWRSGWVNINDGVELLRALDRACSLPAAEVDNLCTQVQHAILSEARMGCRADELRELLSVLDTSDRAGPTALAAKAAFAHFEQDNFGQELRECRSPEQFDGLVEDLEVFRDELGVSVERLIERVEAAKAEFEELEDVDADNIRDEWKERYRSERDADRSVSELFSSLRGDRA